ncbi:GNAT family N-acetyltransferase [Dactylosporangium sp. NPDC048998]|uniref:GNAT family N-acetyltransferase n=1 Tax=Dactylosporangium sp. NPDC048998 TaxID=3363976 RepID=UPI00371193FA
MTACLIRALAHDIRVYGETPFLHAAANNTTAIGLDESLDFELRKHTKFRTFRTP